MNTDSIANVISWFSKLSSSGNDSDHDGRFLLMCADLDRLLYPFMWRSHMATKTKLHSYPYIKRYLLRTTFVYLGLEYVTRVYKKY